MVAVTAQRWTGISSPGNYAPKQAVGQEKVLRVKLTLVPAAAETYPGAAGVPLKDTTADIQAKLGFSSIHWIKPVSHLQCAVGAVEHRFPVEFVLNTTTGVWSMRVFRPAAAVSLPFLELTNTYDMASGPPDPDNNTYTIWVEVYGS